MGAFNLTNPGLQYPDQGYQDNSVSGMSYPKPPITKFFKNQSEAMGQANKALQAIPQAAMTIGPDGAPSFTNPDASGLPKFVKPSFQQAVTTSQGLPAPINPAETKLGKLIHILAAAGQGALAGWGTGNPGQGAEMARNVPFQQAQQRGQLAQQSAQTQLTQSQSMMVPTLYGPMPAGMAKLIFQQMVRAGATIGAAQIGAGAKENVAETAAGSREKVAQINQGPGVKLDQDTANLVGMPELANQEVGRGTLTNINKLMEARGYRFQDMGTNGTGPNSGTWLMDRQGNKIRQISPNSLTFQRGASFAQNKPETVVDSNDPGYAYYTTAADAMANHLPSPMGAGTVGAKTEARSEVPTKVGDQKVAFTTAIAHAGLLRNAAKALANGDNQTLNGLQNSFKNEFGNPGPITAQAIADAYGDEVTKMLASGHLTDTSMGKTAKTLNPSKQNFQQIDSVLGAYQQLAQSKLNMLTKQASASRNQTRSTAPPQPSGATHIFVPGQGLQPVQAPK